MSLTADRDRVRADTALQGLAFADAWRTVVDAWLVELLDAAVAGVGTEGIALIAVGGYGRGDLAPESDLDLLLLHRSRVAPAVVAEKLWYPIWDEGLKLGHSVRTVTEALGLAHDDLDTATSLLSIRHLAGDARLTGALRAAAKDQWRKRSRHYLDTLRTSVLARQATFGEVAFLLEPDLKEGRGGLRDIHALRWAEAARPVLEPGDSTSLSAAEGVLFGARVELHRVAGRPVECLNLQDQDGVGAALGVTADELMAQIAHAARTVSWIADETWDRVGASTPTASSLLGWRSRERPTSSNAPSTFLSQCWRATFGRGGGTSRWPSAVPVASTVRWPSLSDWHRG